ncbi:MAG: hypothetical protein ACRD3J_15775 [Thermoanaerobaculia bacterium]|jgi:hypothetical protein
MARQITGAKLYLAGGHTMQIGAGPVAELVALMEERPEEVRRITVVDGNEIMVHWSHISALQIFSAGK